MKSLLIIFFINCLNINVFSQVMGDTWSTVAEIQGTPCETGYDYYIYCTGEFDRTVYSFNDRGYLYQIYTTQKVSSNSAAKKKLDIKVNEFITNYNVMPIINNGLYTFYYNDDHSVSFTILSNKFGSFFVETEMNTGLISNQ